MALTRKFLSALGIEADKIDEIIEAHVETVNGLKAERDDAKAQADKVSALEADLAKANKQLEDVANDGYKGKYEALKQEYDGYKADITEKAELTKKDTAYRKLLIDAGIREKSIDTVINHTDFKKLELDGENLKDAENLAKSAKEEWADLLITETEQGAGTKFPPKDEGGKEAPTIPTIW